MPGAKSARAFVLGPPRTEAEILDVDPKGDEEFHLMAASPAADYFGKAMGPGDSGPFSPVLGIRLPSAGQHDAHGGFFRSRYGTSRTRESEPKDGVEVDPNPAWRRIDTDWLHSAFQIAIERNNATNNTSLVLAFELGRGGKVLLFAADAQRGNWLSWTKKDWKDGDRKVTARDLLGRTVVYKVGHHGSHNATLNGTESHPYANLSWMGQGEYAREFTAMITAVEAWAREQDGWNHPLPEIKRALLEKCSGRVFQTDTELARMTVTGDPGFRDRAKGTDLYFDYRVEG